MYAPSAMSTPPAPFAFAALVHDVASTYDDEVSRDRRENATEEARVDAQISAATDRHFADNFAES